MGTKTSAELDVFDCNPGEGGLAEFEPEAPRGGTQPREPFVAPPRMAVWPFAVPVIVAASLVGAAVSLVGMRPPPSRPSPPPAPVPVASSPPVKVATPDVSTDARTAKVEGLQSRSAEPVLDPTLEQTLATVGDAYRALDAAALSVVWPGADTAALADSFAALKYQSLTFDRCRMRPNGEDAAVASCDVSIASASKDGDSALRRRRESWTLALNRSGDGWTITGVTAR